MRDIDDVPLSPIMRTLIFLSYRESSSSQSSAMLLLLCVCVLFLSIEEESSNLSIGEIGDEDPMML